MTCQLIDNDNYKDNDNDRTPSIVNGRTWYLCGDRISFNPNKSPHWFFYKIVNNFGDSPEFLPIFVTFL